MWTEKQAARLPEQGYYVVWIGPATPTSRSDHLVGIKHIGPSKCSYIHFSWGKEWCTLMWSCAGTKKQLASYDAVCEKVGDSAPVERYAHFRSHSELIAFLDCTGLLSSFAPGVDVPAPTDVV